MQTFKTFDIVGPRMIGPSSSHTAGAARLEQANDEGSAVYTVTLTAHYTMKWSDTFED